MTTVTYHALDAENADALLPADVFDNAVDPAQLAAFVADPNHELVYAMAGARVIGFASGAIHFHPDKPPAFFLSEVDVTPDWQRQGVAKALCGQLMDIARARGCEGIWLATETDNIPARALYRSLDARETEGIVVYDWDGAMDGHPG